MLGTCLDPQEIDELMEEADVVSGCAGWWCFMVTMIVMMVMMLMVVMMMMVVMMVIVVKTS